MEAMQQFVGLAKMRVSTWLLSLRSSLFFMFLQSSHSGRTSLCLAFKKGEVQTARANDRWSDISIAPLSQHSCSAPQGLSRRSPARRNFKEQLQETDDLHSTESQLSHVFSETS
jgi:hypothetical protein